MTIKTTVRVGAYILRPNDRGWQELLLFKHPDCPEAPLQVPGGGVEPNETLEAALYREVFEECGLSQLTLIRELGVAGICWLQPHKLVSHRHFFLLQAPQDTPDAWDHVVQGNGPDGGMVFSYFWHRPTLDFKLPADLGHFLYPHHIPELYAVI